MVKKTGALLFVIVVSTTLMSQVSAISSQQSTQSTASSVNADAMVVAHNTVREKVGVAPLKWSNDLANYAQQWVDHLKKAKGCQMQHRPRSGVFKQQYGENLYWASPVTWSDGRVEQQSVSAQKVIASFASESAYYNYHSNTCQTGQVCGHYTQVVWKNTTEVGCAMAVCADKSMVWACNYHPAGNYIGERPY